MPNNHNIVSYAVAAFAAIVALYACSIDNHFGNGDDNYFSDFRPIDPNGWLYTNHLRLPVDTLRDSVSHDGTLLLSLRHTNGYPYANIWLELSYPDSDSTRWRDTINIPLADHRGRWRGSGSGPSISITDTIESNFDIRRHQIFTLRHIMRVDTLKGIEQIGIIFHPSD